MDASAEPPSSSPGPLQFGPFVLHPARMLLEENGQAIRLGSRAFRLLVALVERAGRTVSRDELVAMVWPTTVVEDTNLRVHIGALRKALRDGEDGVRYITNVPGRGYSFVMPVTPLGSTADTASPRDATGRSRDARPHNLPVRLTRLIGRSGIVAELAERLERRRLVSIVGPGGMGKTTVAVAVAEQRLQAYEHGARFVDLAPLSDPALVPVALGLALGIEVPRDNPWPGLQAYLHDRRMLIVLDNCEHVIDAAARLVEVILRSAAAVHVLATSREPLAAEGEWTQRLPALGLPDPSDELAHEQALSFPAIELFVERASARSDTFRLAPGDLPALRQLCQLLDGMPLAIELAAGRVDGLGLQALAAGLGDVFRLLTRGRRTALPRHQTLEALLDWSHDLLTADERIVLRRLSRFRATFTMQCAMRVAACERVLPATVEDCVTSLVAKSLVTMEPEAGLVRFRLLYTTRDYAALKLAQAGEVEQLSRRHASHFADRMRQANDEMDSMRTADWLASQRHLVDDLRAAIAWAFSDTGDIEIGIALAFGAAQFIMPIVLEPHVPRLHAALEQVRSMTPPRPELEFQLCTSLCIASGLIGGGADSEAAAAAVFHRAVALADRAESPAQLHGLCTNAMGRGDYPALEATALRIKGLASDPSEPLAVLLADRFRAMSRHYLGDQRAARQLAEAVRDYPAARPYRHYVGQMPRAVSMRGLLARMHWLRGESDQAVQLAEEALYLSVNEHPFVLSQVLATAAIPIALWRGESERAQRLNDRLTVHATCHSQAKWQSWAAHYRFILRLRACAGERDALLQQFDWPSNPMELDIVGTFDEDLVGPLALQRVETGTVGWCAAEVLRARAVTTPRRDPEGSIATSEALLQRSLRIAREQETLAWELRSTTSLARLWQAQSRAAEARAFLGPVVDRCVEGLSTSDVIAARELLDTLR